MSAAPFFLQAADISVDTTLRDVNEFSAAYAENYTLGANATLTFSQQTDGAYAGTISGSGVLEKTGDANLLFEGTLNNFKTPAYLSVQAGTLTFNDATELIGTGVEIVNKATLVFNSNSSFGIASGGTLPGIIVSDNTQSGIIDSVGSGTLYLASAEGAELNVRAGTVIFDGNANFKHITIADTAQLCIGNGNASGGLVGGITLADTGTLRFNRKSSSGNPLTVKGAVSGKGQIVFDGNASVYFGGDLSRFAGTVHVNAGTALLLDISGKGHYVESKASQVTVNGGSFGGNGSVAGNVDVRGKYFAQGAKDVSGGALNLTVSGGVLKIGGDLNFDPAQQEIVEDAEGKQSLRICDYGGQTTVYLGENGCGRVDVAGTANLAGTISLSGAENLKPGTVAVFLRADNPIQGDFQLVSTSANTMLVSPGIAGLGLNEYGVACIENRKLRERNGFREHDGISEFVDYLATQAAADRPNEVAQTINLAGADQLADTINNYSPLAHCALSGMAVRQSNLEVDYLTRILSPGISAPQSPDGLTVPANTQYFTTVLTEFVDNDDGISSPIYNMNSIGIMSGAYRWVDGERLVGASLSVHHGAATPHGFSKGTFSDTSLRARLFASMVPANASWNLLFGASAAVHYYDIDHATPTGMNRAEEGGLEAGAFFAWQMEDELGDNWTLRPFLRFDFNYIRVDTVRENGSYSALEVDAFGYTSYRPRLGFGLEKALLKRDNSQLHLGVDFALVAELGNDPRITSRFKSYANSETTIRGTVEERGAFEITPRMHFQIYEKWSIDTACRVQITPDGGSSAAFSVGINSHF